MSTASKRRDKARKTERKLPAWIKRMSDTELLEVLANAMGCRVEDLPPPEELFRDRRVG